MKLFIRAVNENKGNSGQCDLLAYLPKCLTLTLLYLHQDSIPFAVIGSNTVVEAKGKRVRGRLYPWGIVEGASASSSSSSFSRFTFSPSICDLKLISVLCSCSGELGALRLREAEEHARPHAHAGPEGCDARDPLRELQGPLHPEHDPHGGEGAQPQVGSQDNWVHLSPVK